jgi:hypothetical protein
MRHILKFCSAVVFALTLGLSSAQMLSDELQPPYVLRIIASDESIDGSLVLTDNSDGIGLYIDGDSKAYGSSPWTFSTSGRLNETQLMNATTQLIILGTRGHMWDIDPPTMQMYAVDKAHAQTGYQGTPWPSAYNVAKWKFDIQKDDDGRWIMDSGIGHGEWMADPDQYHQKKDTWSILWWNSKLIFLKCLARVRVIN